MDAPPVRYVTTSDGYNIAYGISGQGTPLVFLPGVFYHVQLAWGYPGLQAWLEGLSARFKLVQVDPRGTGMSSRDVKEDLVREHYLRDIEAVADLLNLEHFLIFGVSFGVDLAVDYALHHPDRVIALILGTSGTGRAGEAIFKALPAQDWEVFLHSLVPRDFTREEGDRIIELTRQASDQTNFFLRWRALSVTGEIEKRLSSLDVQTLVMHARDYAFTPVEEGVKKARLTNGRFVVLDGSDAFGSATQGLRAIEKFLEDLAPQHRPPAQGAVGLSSRELEVIRLLAAGKTNPQIADVLFISSNTVAKHVTSIYTKTGTSNRVEAAAYAQRHNLL